MIIDAHTKERRAWIKRGCTDDDPSERYVALAGVAAWAITMTIVYWTTL